MQETNLSGVKVFCSPDSLTMNSAQYNYVIPVGL